MVSHSASYHCYQKITMLWKHAFLELSYSHAPTSKISYGIKRLQNMHHSVLMCYYASCYSPAQFLEISSLSIINRTSRKLKTFYYFQSNIKSVLGFSSTSNLFYILHCLILFKRYIFYFNTLSFKNVLSCLFPINAS